MQMQRCSVKDQDHGYVHQNVWIRTMRNKVKISTDKIEKCKFILIHFLVGDVDMAVDSLEYRENRKSLKWWSWELGSSLKFRRENSTSFCEQFRKYHLEWKVIYLVCNSDRKIVFNFRVKRTEFQINFFCDGRCLAIKSLNFLTSKTVTSSANINF